MRRLVYAPKAYIFIRSSNLGGKVFDVTTDVVRGEVTQNCGDVSKASFELRNRYQKWLRDEDSGNRSIFLPMDMVTIWLQRVAGRPVQVFTGYLDSVPYYQGYPGNALFEATCTLKKLAFTWFDPGLQTFMQWVKTNDGWYFDPSTGEGLNAPAKGQGTAVAGSAALPGNTNINDTGFANLLGRFMTDIAGWSADDVLISELPANIPKQAAQLFNKIQTDTLQDVKAMEDYFKVAMGIKGWANPDSSTPTDSSGNPTRTTATQDIFKKIQKRADADNVPILVLALAAFVLTNFDETYSVGPDAGVTNWGYGIYALQPKTVAAGVGSGSIFSTDLVDDSIDGKKPSELMDVAVATDVFAKRLNKNQGPWVVSAKANDLTAVKTWIEKALGRPLPKVDLASAFNSVKQLGAASVVVTPPTDSPSTTGGSSVSFASPNVQSALTAKEKQTVTAQYSDAKPWLAAMVLKAKNISKTLTVTPPGTGKNANVIAFTGTQSDLQKFFKSLAGDSSIDSVSMLLAGANEAQVLRKGVASNVTNTNGTKPSTIAITQATQPASTQTNSSSASSTTATDGSATFSQLATFSANAAFAANFAFPTNVVESALLTGNRALMNDISCLDGVKQFCQASLRTFRSLPDGRFLAFYPDYFGAYRKPYWKIYNIELTDFGIQLNDEALATHVYVVGDTFDGDGQITMEDDVSTRGVATITQAFMLNSFIEPYKAPVNKTGANTPPPIGRLVDAFTFLQHYGARPHKEEQPLIRNTLYEFLIAWQKFMYLWAQTFATKISFTFQPEVMAGGLIEFPDHDVQMYCESVTHRWDYEGGFDTDAVMTAPSLTGTNNDRTHKPGFALGGNINTVGIE